MLAQALVSRELALAGVGGDDEILQADAALAVLAGDDPHADAQLLTEMMGTLLAQLKVCNCRQLDRAQDAL